MRADSVDSGLPSRGSVVATAGALGGLVAYAPWTLPYLGAAAGSGVVFVIGAVAYEAIKKHRERTKPRWKAITEGQPITDDEIAELVRILRAARGPLSNAAVADKAGISKGEASKRVSKALKRGLVTRHRTGKEVQIALLH